MPESNILIFNKVTNEFNRSPQIGTAFALGITQKGMEWSHDFIGLDENNEQVFEENDTKLIWDGKGFRKEAEVVATGGTLEVGTVATTKVAEGGTPSSSVTLNETTGKYDFTFDLVDGATGEDFVDAYRNANAFLASSDDATVVTAIEAAIKGDTGDSALKVWNDAGNTGDAAAFVADITGAKGDGITGVVANSDDSITVTYGDGATVTTGSLKSTVKGDAFAYSDFTSAQLDALKGDAFAYSDFTSAQLDALKGAAFAYSDFTSAQLDALKGDAFAYSDFTSAQLDVLKGDSAYETYVSLNPDATEQDFLNSLKSTDVGLTAEYNGSTGELTITSNV